MDESPLFILFGVQPDLIPSTLDVTKMSMSRLSENLRISNRYDVACLQAPKPTPYRSDAPTPYFNYLYTGRAFLEGLPGGDPSGNPSLPNH
jgi:hypothetical protein